MGGCSLGQLKIPGLLVFFRVISWTPYPCLSLFILDARHDAEEPHMLQLHALGCRETSMVIIIGHPLSDTYLLWENYF